MATIEELRRWMGGIEGENLEFKEASTNYHFEKLTKYAVALTNEGGGKIILGVTDEHPRRIIGSTAYAQPERTRRGLIDRLKINITVEELHAPEGRVLVFHIPSRPRGVALQYGGQFWGRDADSLVGLSSDRIREIVAELGNDFSADVCEGLTLDDLDPASIEVFRDRWARHSKNERVRTHDDEQVLRNIEVLGDAGITIAGLILFGNREAIRTHLAQSEIVFEYRANDAAGPAQQRENLTGPFFLIFEKLWELINLRNDQQHFQDGPFVLNLPTFDERAIREAVLNAVSHRHYQMAGNVFVRQYPDRLVVESPGGFLPEIDAENILNRQAPRNRRIAEVLALCGLVERSGQGVDLMYERAIRQSKPHPDYTGSDEHTVVLTLGGRMLDPSFVRFLENYAPQDLDALGTDDWLALNRVSQERQLSESLGSRTEHLLNMGLIVRASGGRFILPRVYFQFHNRADSFDRLRGEEANKERLETYLLDFRMDGRSISELEEAFHDIERADLGTLLSELKSEERIYTEGERRWTRYFPGQPE